MFVSDITRILPSSLEWMVLFNLDALSSLFDDDTIKRMFFVPGKTKLASFSHVVLTSAGSVLAAKNQTELLNPVDGTIWSPPREEESLFSRFRHELSNFDLDKADCLGVGELEHFFPPAVLYLIIEAGIGKAQALFSQEPTRVNFELLRVIGVEYLQGDWIDNQYLAKFSVDLSSHISAGRLSDFSKTGYCNSFFLRHGSIGPTLAKGLLDAAVSKIADARRLCVDLLMDLGQRALKHPMPMLCQPPPPKAPFPFGDVVPLGLLLMALRSGAADRKFVQKIEKLISNKRQGALWPFHQGDIPTATDSALVLLGLQNGEAVEALEVFGDGIGGYFPQLWDQEAQFGKMQIASWNRHWCQPDFATSCLIRALRRNSGLSLNTSVEYLEMGFEHRGGLFFANPYLADWALALAIQEDESAEALRAKLLDDILSSMNEDYSFGSFDRPLSTALAVLCLAALRHRTRTMLLAQYRLAEFIRSGNTWPIPIPFYSSMKLPDFPIHEFGPEERNDSKDDQIVQVGNQLHAISYYLDQHRMVESAFIFLGLSEQCGGEETEFDHKIQRMDGGHPRYRCPHHSSYISAHLLSHYAAKELASSIQAGK